MFKTRKRARVTSVAAVMGAASLLAACGSSTHHNAASTTGTTGATTSPASSSGAKTSPASSSGAGAATGLAAQVAAAKAYVARVSQIPTSIPDTVPLKSKPAAGKTMVFLQCDVSQCTTEAQGLTAAAAAVGWHVKILNYQSANPATLIAAMQQALQYKPAAVAFSGIPEAEWANELPAYEKAGVPIVLGYVGPQKLNNTIIANIGGPSYVALTATAIANEFIANSNGKGHALLFQVPNFPILATYDTTFQSVVKKDCSGCKVTTLTGTIAQVTGGGTVPAIVSAVQRDPSINYVVTDNGPWVDGLPAALTAAGLHAQILGESGDTENLTDVKSGTELAFTGLALDYGEYAMLDAVLRHDEGMPVPASESQLPLQLLTKGGNFAINISFNQPADYAAQMKKLWKVG